MAVEQRFWTLPKGARQSPPKRRQCCKGAPGVGACRHLRAHRAWSAHHDLPKRGRAGGGKGSEGAKLRQVPPQSKTHVPQTEKSGGARSVQ